MKTTTLFFLLLATPTFAAAEGYAPVPDIDWTSLATERKPTSSWEIKPSLPTGDDMAPGGYLNPLKVEQDSSGEVRIRPSLPTGDVLAPGGYLNPLVISPK